MADAESALREANRWLLPIAQNDLRRELVALHLKTISRKTGETDLDLMLEIYLSELVVYPGDIVRDVLRRWPGKFFPAFIELKDAITSDRRIIERRLRIRALEAFLRGGATPPRERVTPDQADAIRAKYAVEDQLEDKQT